MLKFPLFPWFGRVFILVNWCTKRSIFAERRVFCPHLRNTLQRKTKMTVIYLIITIRRNWSWRKTSTALVKAHSLGTVHRISVYKKKKQHAILLNRKAPQKHAIPSILRKPYSVHSSRINQAPSWVPNHYLRSSSLFFWKNTHMNLFSSLKPESSRLLCLYIMILWEKKSYFREATPQHLMNTKMTSI